MIELKEHPLRKVLSDEIRARPYELLQAPARASHLAALSGEHGAEDDNAHIASLCRAFGVEPPAPGANHFTADMGPFRLKWERHTEFAAYTFYNGGPFADPFAEPVINAVPEDWLRSMPGEILSAVHIALEAPDSPPRPFSGLAALFGCNIITGSRMLGGRAEAWSDFCNHKDGFGRILIRDKGLNRRAAGRLVQRLLEVETYRMMAMLAFPLARDARPRVAAAELRLSKIVSRLTTTEGIAKERELLKKLSGLAAEIENISTSVNFRFSAARAYYGLVRRRVEELREESIEGLQPPGEFLYRRLAPAMETCESVAARQEKLSQRVAHANDLLRTRVSIAMEEQNQALLISMNRRAKLQIRLQETVEGLSVVAISYYLLGLVKFIAKGAAAAGFPVNADIAVSLALPLVVAAVWLGMRRLRKSIAGAHDGGKQTPP